MFWSVFFGVYVGGLALFGTGLAIEETTTWWRKRQEDKAWKTT